MKLKNGMSLTTGEKRQLSFHHDTGCGTVGCKKPSKKIKIEFSPEFLKLLENLKIDSESGMSFLENKEKWSQFENEIFCSIIGKFSIWFSCELKMFSLQEVAPEP